MNMLVKMQDKTILWNDPGRCAGRVALVAGARVGRPDCRPCSWAQRSCRSGVEKPEVAIAQNIAPCSG